MKKFNGWLLSPELANCKQIWLQLPTDQSRMIFLSVVPHLDETGRISMSAAKIQEKCFPLLGADFKFCIDKAVMSWTITKPALAVPDGAGNIVFRDFERLNKELLKQRRAEEKKQAEDSQEAKLRKQFYFEVCQGFIKCKGFSVEDPGEVWPYVRRYGKVLRDIYDQAGGSIETAVGVMWQAKKTLDGAKFPWGLDAVGRNYLNYFKEYDDEKRRRAGRTGTRPR